MTNAKILIADDNPDILAALDIQLKNHGYDVLVCNSADLAVAHAQKFLPDVLIVDIWMAVGKKMILKSEDNGFDVIDRINKLPQTRGTPVIYITGANSPELNMRVQHSGAFALCRKPLNFNELLKTIELAIQSRGNRAMTIGSQSESNGDRFFSGISEGKL